MKDIISFVVFSVLSAYTFGQNTYDTVYYDSRWKTTNKENHSFYRIIEKQNNGKIICKDYWKTGEIQMKGVYSSLDPDINDGELIYYFKNGQIKELTNYVNDKPTTLTKLYKEDGTLEMDCASNLEMLDNTDKMNKAVTSFISFVNRKIKYPEYSRNAGIEGQVIVAFYINKEGLPYRIKVSKSVNNELDNEAIRIISLYKWPSPTYKGDKTLVLVALPVTFILK